MASTLAPSITYPGRQSSAAAQHVYTRWDGGEDMILMIYESANDSAEEERNDERNDFENRKQLAG